MHYSPLRYPGGKTRLYNKICDMLDRLNVPDDVRFVEPFAGGAGLGLALLANGRIGHLVINDVDAGVSAFWYCAVYKTEELCENIENLPVTCAEYERQAKKLTEENLSITDLASAFFFVNRTSYSGIVTGGMMGGTEQSRSRIGDRFNKETLIRKIRNIGALKTKITVSRQDAFQLIPQGRLESKTFYFIDPPYRKYGERLYGKWFRQDDHRKLSEVLSEISIPVWCVVYDDSPYIKELYEGFYSERVPVSYSANVHSKRFERLFFNATPRKTELFDKYEDWK